MNTCEHCEFFKDVFGNFVQCVKTGQFVDYEYWNDIEVENCPLKEEPPEVKTMVCFECGGTMKYIESKITGHKHGKCRDCGLTFME